MYGRLYKRYFGHDSFIELCGKYHASSLPRQIHASLCTGELNAIRKHNCFLCSPLYVKGVSLGYVGRIKT